MKLSLADYSPSMKVTLGQYSLNKRLIMETVGQFDPYRINLRQMHLMRKDSTIRLGLHAIYVPMVNAAWHMECEDPQIAAFADKAFRPIWSRLLLQMLTSLEFGYQAIVKRYMLSDEASSWTYEDDKGNEKKVWTSSNVQPIVWNDPRALRPDGARPVFTNDGQTFNGIQHSDINRTRGTNDDTPDVPASHSLWVTNERDSSFGDWFGYPRTGYAFRYWWSYWFQYLLKDRHFEQDADPPLRVDVPNELVVNPDDPNGPPITAQELGMRIGSALRDGATVVLPSDVYENEESGRLAPHARKWDAQFMRGGENLKPMQDSLDQLNQMKLRAVLMGPDSGVLAEGSSNGQTAAQQMSDLLHEGQAVLMGELDQLLNDHMLPDLLAQNFVDPPDCRKVTTGFRPEDMTLANQIITILTQQDPASLDLDIRKLVKSVGLPQTPPGESQAQAPAEGGGPPQVQGDQGVNGGTPPVGAPPAAPGQQAGAATGTAASGDGISVQEFSLAESRDLELERPQLPPLRQFTDPHIGELLDDVYTDLADLLDQVYSAPEKALQAARAEDLALAFSAGSSASGHGIAGAWEPNLHPRWPAHTGHGGQFAEVTVKGLLDLVSKSASGQADVTWLAKGAKNIETVKARAAADGRLQLTVTRKDGRGAHVFADAESDIAKVIGRFAQIDSGQRVADTDVQALGAKAPRPPRPETEDTTPVPTMPNAPVPTKAAWNQAREQAAVDPRDKWPPEKGELAQDTLGPFDDTREMWQNDRGEYDPERRAVHEKILDALFKDAQPSDDPQVVYTIGGPGVGKSTFGLHDVEIPPGTVALNNDIIKRMLPEYQKMAPKSKPKADDYAAFGTHDEAGDIMREAIQRAVKQGIPLQIEGTGNDRPGVFQDVMHYMAKPTAEGGAGYKVKVLLFDLPTDGAIYRAVERSKEPGGRWLSPGYIEDTHMKVARVFLGYKDMPWISEIHLYSTLPERPDPPTKIGERVADGAWNFTDPAAYAWFVQKAGGNHGRLG